MDRLTRPKDGPGWMRWVESAIPRLDAAIRNKVTPPVGAMVVWPGGGTPPVNWLTADGSTFSAATWPLLDEQLGGTTLPNPAAVSGHGWIIRAG